MKIKTNKKYFDKELEKIEKALDGNAHLDSLKGILFTVNESYAELIVSDGNLSIKSKIEKNENFQIEDPGVILIPGKLLIKLIKKMSNEIILEKKGSKLIVTSENSKANINLLEKNDYPKINFDINGSEFLIKKQSLENIINNVSFAVSTRDKQIIFNGINLKGSGSKIYASATNKFRLAREVMEVEGEVDFNITLLPKNLKAFLPSEDQEVEITVSNNKIKTYYKNITVLSNLLDGIYPDISSKIPSDFDLNKTLEIDESTLLKLIDNVTVINNENNNKIKIKITKEDLLITSYRSEIGNVEAKTSDIVWVGDDFEITINGDFLSSAIKKFNGKIKLMFTEKDNLFLIVGSSNKKLIQLILPYRDY